MLKTVLMVCVVAYLTQQSASVELRVVLNQLEVKSYPMIPDVCLNYPYDKCGNLNLLQEALMEARSWFGMPEMPDTDFKYEPRWKPSFVDRDYHMCNYTTHDDLWMSFPFGNGSKYVRLIDGLQYVTCMSGVCDDYVYFRGWKYGCVASWRTRAFMALWWKKTDEEDTPTKCFKRWCFVKIKVTYPESCKCAQIQSCGNFMAFDGK